MEHEAIAVGGEHEGDVQCLGVVERLLHSITDAVGIVLGLDDRDGNVRLVVEDVVGALGLSARDQLAAHDDAALGEAHLLADLQHLVPPHSAQGGGDELGADIPFGEALLVNRGQHALGRLHFMPILRRRILPPWAQVKTIA